MVARLDDHHPNTKWPYLQAEGFAQSFQGKFGGAVHRLVRDRDQAADRTDVDDVATALPPHGRQHSAADPECAEEINLQLPLRLFDRGILDRSCNRHPGVIHHNIEPPLAAENRPDHLLHGMVLGYVRS